VKPAPSSTRGLLKDKRVLIALGGAGLLGLFALLRKGSGGGGSVPVFDSSSTDLASALQGFGDRLSDISDKLDQQPTRGTGSDPARNDPKQDPWGWDSAGRARPGRAGSPLPGGPLSAPPKWPGDPVTRRPGPVSRK
jgi:hypothetical protein